MSETITPQHPAVVLRSHYQHLRSMLAVAVIAIVGLTAAVVVLAVTHKTHTIVVTPAARVSAPSPTADTGARLDHRGLGDRANSLSQTADRGERLDHRGLTGTTSGR